MDKDKIVLKDGMEIILSSSQGIGSLHVSAGSKATACQIWEYFNKDNLTEVSIKNGEGLIVGTYKDMILDHITAIENADGTVEIIFCLRSKTENEILMEKIAALESERQTQDEAIGDLGQAVSDIAEGSKKENEILMEKIAALESEQQTILMEKIATLKSEQQTQDEAIGDLGQAVSDIAEGGTV